MSAIRCARSRTASSNATGAMIARCCKRCRKPGSRAPTATRRSRAASRCCATRASSPGLRPTASRSSPAEMAAQFRFTSDGLIETDFSNWAAMREKFLAICKGHDRETIAASVQKIAEDLSVQSVRWWLESHRRQEAGARGRAVRERAAQPAARRDAAGRGGLHLPGDGRRRPFGRRRRRVPARARRHADLARAPPPARQRLPRARTSTGGSTRCSKRPACGASPDARSRHRSI